MNLNKAMIIGNVVRDPESRTTPNGKTVSNFAIATNYTWTDAAGNKQEKAEFHNIVAWRRLAEISSQYLKKGSKIYIPRIGNYSIWVSPREVCVPEWCTFLNL